MRKLLFLLLCTVSMYGQAEFDAGIQITGGQTTTSTSNKLLSQESDGVVNYIHALSLPLSTVNISALQKKSDLSTGLIKNGLITINADPTKYDISAGIGIISNFDDPENPISTLISFPAFTAITPTYLLTGNITYIAINSSSAIVMQASPFTSIQRRDLIILGAVIHSNLTNINVVNNISAPTNADTNQLHDFMEAIGALNITGNKYTANGANMQLNKSAGTIFKFGVNFANDWKSPHQLSQASGTALTFRYRTQNGTEGSDRINLDPSLYDLNNVYTSVPNNKFVIETIVTFQTGLTRILKAQNYYDDLASARMAIFTRQFVVEPNSLENGIIRGYVIMRNTTTSLQNVADAEILEAQKFGGVASGGVALTFASIVAALGYTPENIANKQNSLTADGTGVKYPTVDAVNKLVNFVTPEQYGAIGDGITDDKTAIQNAINSGKMVLINGTYFTSGTITVSNKSKLQGQGKLLITADLPIFDVKSNDVEISGLSFEGNGRGTVTNYVTTRPLQSGIKIFGATDLSINYKNIKISNCYFYNLGGKGIDISFNYSTQYSGGAIISDCFADTCFIGYYTGDRAEYNQISNCKASNCEVGFNALGGNNPLTGCSLDNNRTGVLLETGQNPGHSTVTGGSINHSKDRAVWANGEDGGYIFNGVEILVGGNIYIQNSDKIQFYNCDIIATTIDIITSTNTMFSNCKFDTTPTFTGINSAQFINTKWIGTPPVGFFDTINNDLLISNMPPTFTTSADILVREISDGKLKKLGFVPYNPSAYPVNLGGETIASVTTRNGNNSLNIGLSGTALSAGGAAGWITGNGTSTYSGGLIASLSGVPKAYYYVSGSYAMIETASGIGAKIQANGVDALVLETTGAMKIPNLGNGSTTRMIEADLNGVTSATKIVTSGVYAPTLTNTTNVSSSTLNQATYTRIGDIVTVTIGFQIAFTTTGTDTVLNVTLPIATTDTTQNGIGNGNVTTGGGATNAYGVVNMSTTTSANFTLYPLTNASSAVGSLVFQYNLN